MPGAHSKEAKKEENGLSLPRGATDLALHGPDMMSSPARNAFARRSTLPRSSRVSPGPDAKPASDARDHLFARTAKSRTSGASERVAHAPSRRDEKRRGALGARAEGQPGDMTQRRSPRRSFETHDPSSVLPARAAAGRLAPRLRKSPPPQTSEAESFEQQSSLEIRELKILSSAFNLKNVRKPKRKGAPPGVSREQPGVDGGGVSQNEEFSGGRRSRPISDVEFSRELSKEDARTRRPLALFSCPRARSTSRPGRPSRI